MSTFSAPGPGPASAAELSLWSAPRYPLRSSMTFSTAALPHPNAVRWTALVAFCISAPLLIAFRDTIPGIVAWSLSLAATIATREGAFQRRLGTLLGSIAVLAFAPINTDTSTAHFIALAIPFFIVIAGPFLFLGRTDPGVIRSRIWPRRFRWQDLVYVLISIPLSWLAFHFYFGVVNPEVPSHWYLPPVPDSESIWRLFIGINLVGLWDELFFVNTVYAVLRSLFPFAVANAAQAVIYTTILYRMAFTGIGVPIVYVFALTQGSMFEESENLLYVLIVHFIVDAFLFAAIVAHYYPGASFIHF